MDMKTSVFITFLHERMAQNPQIFNFYLSKNPSPLRPPLLVKSLSLSLSLSSPLLSPSPAMVADFSAPSFSLGLDLDNQEEETLDLDNGPEEPQYPALRRLTRGLPRPIPSNLADDDDDIEDFSSQGDEIHLDPDISPSLQSHATCSNSKVSLRYCGVLRSQSTSKSKATKIIPPYKHASVSANFEASSSKESFPRSTSSPLRKYSFDLDPSFSLGLDLDFGENHLMQQEYPSFQNPSNQEEDEDIGLHKSVYHDDLQEPQQGRVLKPLRQGLPSLAPSILAEDGKINLGAEINNLSSLGPKDHRNADISPSVRSHATCSGSKVSVPYHGVLSTQSASKLKTPHITTSYSTSVQASFEASSSKGQFSKLTVSPIRKIHLLDSDSDEHASSKGKTNGTDVDPSSKKRKSVPFQSAMKNAEKAFQSRKHQAESLWKDFCSKENVNLASPALDEFCNEYFKASKDQNVSHYKETAPSFCSSRVLDPDDSVDDFESPFQQKNSSIETDHNWDFHHPKPPAYRYLYNDNVRIRTLVQERLPHFAPIGSRYHSGNQQLGGDDLDYMGQFCHGDGPSQGCTSNGKGTERNSKAKQKRAKVTNSKEAIENTGNWMNPRNNTTIPMDAGRRRVSAVGSQTGGRWFTGQDGRKVYVSKNGQELTGQSAYRQHRKESGGRFPRGKKKAATTSKKKKKS